MDCKKICSLAFDFENKLLDKETNIYIENHLKSCEKCKIYFASCEKLAKIYPNYEADFEYPQNLNEKIKKSLESLEKTSVL